MCAISTNLRQPKQILKLLQNVSLLLQLGHIAMTLNTPKKFITQTKCLLLVTTVNCYS